MKYVKYLVVMSITLFSLSSSTTTTSSLSEGIYPGNLLPDIKNAENISGTSMNLSDLRGQKVLLNFWAAYDAESHKDNVLLSNLIEKNGYDVQMISMSFDKSQAVFEKTIAIDNVDNTHQFMVSENNQKDLISRYKLEKGFKNYLLDENGVVMATNVSTDDLDRLLKKN